MLAAYNVYNPTNSANENINVTCVCNLINIPIVVEWTGGWATQNSTGKICRTRKTPRLRPDAVQCGRSGRKLIYLYIYMYICLSAQRCATRRCMVAINSLQIFANEFFSWVNIIFQVFNFFCANNKTRNESNAKIFFKFYKEIHIFKFSLWYAIFLVPEKR